MDLPARVDLPAPVAPALAEQAPPAAKALPGGPGGPGPTGRTAPPGRTGHAAAAAVAAATGFPAPAPRTPAPVPPDAGPGSSDAEAPKRRTGKGGTDDPDAAEGGTERRNGMGTPALVLGLLAAGTCWTGWAGVVLGLFGAAAGYLGARRAWSGLATDGASSLGGFALGVIGLVVGVVVVWPTLFGTGNFGDGLTLDQCLQQANGAFQMHMCKSQHITEFNQRFPNAAT